MSIFIPVCSDTSHNIRHSGSNETQLTLKSILKKIQNVILNGVISLSLIYERIGRIHVLYTHCLFTCLTFSKKKCVSLFLSIPASFFLPFTFTHTEIRLHTLVILFSCLSYTQKCMTSSFRRIQKQEIVQKCRNTLRLYVIIIFSLITSILLW